nr:sulfite exporter TauE/SafE family protein [Caldanaerobius polysaccharolyticus]
MVLLIFFIIGILSGIVGGMGIGGGTILIPALNVFSGIDQHYAQSVNLIAFIPMAISALISHYKNRNLLFSVIAALIPGGVIGSILGSCIAVSLSSHLLKKMFSIFLLFMGIYEILYKNNKKSP